MSTGFGQAVRAWDATDVCQAIGAKCYRFKPLCGY